MAKTDELEDPEIMMRSAAAVRFHEQDDTKFLGPSSGIAMTRLVMQLAKECTGARSISEIVSEVKARQIKAHFELEDTKPTSKIYPLTSNIAAEGLPSDRGLVDRLVQLFNLKVQPMYQMLHEPSFRKDLEAVYAGSTDDYQNFVVRMVIAISLQKADAQYAGLADSYYLAALQYLEPIIQAMDLRTLQCCVLIAEYSLVTPTRTAVYYIIGLAVRLVQALGFNEERTITKLPNGEDADVMEVDLRRRLFWCVWNMDMGMAHTLGRPTALATKQEHIDVQFFSTTDDNYITPNGIIPGKGGTLAKWVCIHFHKMRLVQLEIRRKLYRKLQEEPKNDRHPWFQTMERKMAEWRDRTPGDDVGSGLDKLWFVGQYNTIVVMLYRPSPQIPRPSVEAARRCFEACEFNIYLYRKQIEAKNVELNWIFSQSIFMTLNTVLWSLSYVEIRRSYPKHKVEELFSIALDAIDLTAQHWPGIVSAHELYICLIDACMRVYDSESDLPISARSPEASASPESVHSQHRSRTESPATLSTASFATTPDVSNAAQHIYSRQSHVGPPSINACEGQIPLPDLYNPFGYEMEPPHQLAPLLGDPVTQFPSGIPPPPTSAPSGMTSPSYEPNMPHPSAPFRPYDVPGDQFHRPVLEPDPVSSLDAGLAPPFPGAYPWDGRARSPIDSWRGPKYTRHGSPLPGPYGYEAKDEPYNDQYMYPQDSFYPRSDLYGLNPTQHTELLHELETNGVGNLDKQIQQQRAIWHRPRAPPSQ
ncbi:MAG: hypothetical protein M1822_003966 [Bathelium mastoideum]|nr:MAG: hypothetical protein M1822_003966 [Bathelium mastoideum]